MLAQDIGAEIFVTVGNDLKREFLQTQYKISNDPSSRIVQLPLQQASVEMPPVRGVIQAAMVLKDSVIDNMTYSDFSAAVRPKVVGSLNLHNAFLTQHLDFFILLSSAAGIVGNSGQANYAAGCTFQDALARYRVRLGLPAHSIDLGMIQSAGAALRGAKTKQDAVKIITDTLVLRLQQLLTMGSKDISQSQSITELGADSLVAVELRNWISREMDAEVQTLEVLLDTDNNTFRSNRPPRQTELPDDLDRYLLPSVDLLKMQWVLQRLAAMSAASEEEYELLNPYDDDDDNDSDDDGAVP
ncbi:uncharacterized protein ATNIH1004_009203 [Aspergillus tanneri]|uniref:Carrier domain-containing protein n=2 Tax=Aspergillus tanneri TaxID=1220188 RepID=A0A5M9MDC6_9EURO|nr:uncharacterized protein ATNIH1004_009203 [Aspergillus tanneri]KAA8644992.1 hypothetical protein ATNIH1004_009203 [Aspergillus tanneri]